MHTCAPAAVRSVQHRPGAAVTGAAAPTAAADVSRHRRKERKWRVNVIVVGQRRLHLHAAAEGQHEVGSQNSEKPSPLAAAPSFPPTISHEWGK